MHMETWTDKTEEKLQTSLAETESEKETRVLSEINKKDRFSVGFVQVMLVITLLIAAVLFRSFGGDVYEQVRLRCANLLSDPLHYRDTISSYEETYEEM